MRLLSIQPHFDDWELTTAGAWMEWKRRGVPLEGVVLVVTDGGVGHHEMSHAETVARRLDEGRKAAELAGFELVRLTDDQGELFREATLECDARLRSALWNAVATIKPDLLFCPCLPDNPLDGCHNDHFAVAQAVWRTAYLFAVPRAFDNYPASYHRVQPAILCTDDAYLHPRLLDLAVDVAPVFDLLARLVDCHASQVYEWIPWIGRYERPQGPDDMKARLLDRYKASGARVGFEGEGLYQFFTESSWCRKLTKEEKDLFHVVSK